MVSLANAVGSHALSNQLKRDGVLGTILTPPGSLAGQVTVVTADAPMNPLGPMDWVKSQGATLPAAGAGCVVLYAEGPFGRTPYCVWFDGAYSPIAPVTAAAWVAPTLINSWANLGSGFETAEYLKDPFGFVHLKGVIVGGATGSIAFTLPAGFRPGATTLNAAGGSAVVVDVEIAPEGNVTPFFASGVNIGLSGITFLAEN